MKVGDISTNPMAFRIMWCRWSQKSPPSTNYLELGQSDNEVGLWGCFRRNIEHVEQGVGIISSVTVIIHWLPWRYSVCDLYTYD